MMNAWPLSLSRNDLSPSSARFAIADGDAATTSRTFCCVATSGGDATACAGRSRCTSEKPIASTMTPTVARRKRGAPLNSANSHHSSWL